jgi:hypothetical protein
MAPWLLFWLKSGLVAVLQEPVTAPIGGDDERTSAKVTVDAIRATNSSFLACNRGDLLIIDYSSPGAKLGRHSEQCVRLIFSVTCEAHKGVALTGDQIHGERPRLSWLARGNSREWCCSRSDIPTQLFLDRRKVVRERQQYRPMLGIAHVPEAKDNPAGRYRLLKLVAVLIHDNQNFGWCRR